MEMTAWGRLLGFSMERWDSRGQSMAMGEVWRPKAVRALRCEEGM